MTRKNFSILGFKMIAVIAVMLLCSAFLPLLLSFVLPSALPAGAMDYIATAVMYIILIPVAWLLFRKTKKDLPETLPAETKPLSVIAMLGLFCLCMAVTYILNLVGMGVTSVMLKIFGGNMLNAVAEMVLGTNLFYCFIAVGLVGPIVEELIFRKLLLDRLRPAGELTAILFSSIAFGLYHLNFTQFFYAAALGIIFSYITIRTGSILYSTLLHIAINTYSSVFVNYISSRINYENPTDPTSILFLLVILGGYALFFIGGIVLIAIVLGKDKIHLNKSVGAGIPVTAKSVLLNPGVILYIVGCLGMFIYMSSIKI